MFHEDLFSHYEDVQTGTLFDGITGTKIPNIDAIDERVVLN